jgi:hypothetical protein
MVGYRVTARYMCDKYSRHDYRCDYVVIHILYDTKCIAGTAPVM